MEARFAHIPWVQKLCKDADAFARMPTSRAFACVALPTLLHICRVVRSDPTYTCRWGANRALHSPEETGPEWGRIQWESVAGGNIKRGSHCGKSDGSSIRSLHTHVPCDPAMPPPGTHPRGMKTYIHTEMHTQMFKAALSIVAIEKWKQPKCLPTDEKIDKTGIGLARGNGVGMPNECKVCFGPMGMCQS